MGIPTVESRVCTVKRVTFRSSNRTVENYLVKINHEWNLSSQPVLEENY